MDVREVSAMLDIMNTAYAPFTSRMTDEERKAQIRVWSMFLKNDDPKVVAKVLERHIATNRFMPTIAEIRQGIREMTLPSPNDLLLELQRQAKKSVTTTTELVSFGQNGQADTYRQISFRDEAFEELSPILRKYVKTAKGLQDWYGRFLYDRERCTKEFYKDITDLQERMDVAPLLEERV